MKTDQELFKQSHREEKHNKHKTQIEEYELALQEMNYTVAKKTLIYIGESIEIVTL